MIKSTVYDWENNIKRDMSLAEFVGQLNDGHLAKKQFKDHFCQKGKKDKWNTTQKANISTN